METKTVKEPKDLEVKIGTKAQVLWTNIAKEARVLIESSQQNIIVQTAVLEMAEKKIAEEKAKSKSS